MINDRLLQMREISVDIIYKNSWYMKITVKMDDGWKIEKPSEITTPK